MYKVEAMTFGQQIKRWRIAAGLTQSVLAEALGVKQQTVADWEDDDHRPRIGKLDLLADALKIDHQVMRDAFFDSAEAEVPERPLEPSDRELLMRLVGEMEAIHSLLMANVAAEQDRRAAQNSPPEPQPPTTPAQPERPRRPRGRG